MLECQCGCNMRRTALQPTFHTNYMEGMAMFVALPSIKIWKVKLIPSFVANILQSPVFIEEQAMFIAYSVRIGNVYYYKVYTQQ